MPHSFPYEQHYQTAEKKDKGCWQEETTQMFSPNGAPGDPTRRNCLAATTPEHRIDPPFYTWGISLDPYSSDDTLGTIYGHSSGIFADLPSLIPVVRRVLVVIHSGLPHFLYIQDVRQ
jgi:hypothetical protein